MEKAMTRASRRDRTLRTPRRKGAGVVYLLLAVVLLLVAGVVYVGASVYGKINTAIEKVIVTSPPVTGTPQATPAPLDPINILLIGVDRREGESSALNDVNILVHIDQQRRFASMLSIPRDTWVDIPDYGYSKINAAFNVGQNDHAAEGGGPVWTKRTMESFLGIRVHYYALVNFRGFERIVDFLGGVTIDVPAPLVDNEYPTENYGYTRVYIPAGLQHMDGATALKYARSRHADNDLYRNQRQQQVLLAMRDQLLQRGVLSYLENLDAVLNQFAETFETDVPKEKIIALAQLAPKIERENIASYALGIECFSEVLTPTYKLIPNLRCVEDAVSEMQMDPSMRNLREEAAQIEVQNGTLTCAGCASDTAEHLRARGFYVLTFGNAENAGYYTHTLILDSGDHPFTREQLAELLNVSPEDVRQEIVSNSQADIVIILGDDFQRLEP
jgi:LCP family protein required for cell wall assembly